LDVVVGVRIRRWVVLNFPVACVRHNRPVRCMLDRDEDMAMTGSRHPLIGKYKVYERFLMLKCRLLCSPEEVMPSEI